MRILAVGDHFVPSTAYRAAFDAPSDVSERSDVRQGSLLDPSEPVGSPELSLTEVSWSPDKAEQHRLQQVMERQGPNAVSTDPEVLRAVADAEVLVVHFAPVGVELLAAAPRLRLVVVARAGLENVDIEAATARGVTVSGVAGRNASAVAELAVGLMLSECRNIARADASVKAGGWRKEFGAPMIELRDATVGLLGFGHVARQLVAKLAGFGPRVLVHDPFVAPEAMRQAGVEPADFEEVFRCSDFVHVMARLTARTERFVGAEQFGWMKPNGYFLNTARSRLVDTDALYRALASGQIAGAGLDVFDSEPLPEDSPWRALDNVTFTTHYGGDTTGTVHTSAALVRDRIAEFHDTGDVNGAANGPAVSGAAGDSAAVGTQEPPDAAR